MMEVGVDEAGRGPVIGPLVVCSVAIPDNEVQLLSDMGVKDSKDITPKKREEIRQWFLRNCVERKWSYSIIQCDPKRIDNSVYHGGLNNLEAELFAESINGLNLGPEVDVNITCDACDVDAQRFSRKISQMLENWPWGNSKINSYHKADENYLVVGMASILAKQARDDAVQSIQRKFEFPIGSGYPSDKVTIQAVKMMIGSVPHEDLRWSWSTVKRIWHETNKHEMPTRSLVSGEQRKLF